MSPKLMALFALFLGACASWDPNDITPINQAEDTADRFLGRDPTMQRFFDTCTGYVVFPTIGKGAWIIGGAHGTGVLFEKGKAVGMAAVTQLSVGLQIGGQSFSQIIFFGTDENLESFKASKFTFGANMSAVAANVGAAGQTKYNSGIATFLHVKGGLMAEASVSGQRFSYEALPEEAAKE